MKRIKIILQLAIIVFILFGAVPCWAQQHDVDLFVKANTAYTQEDYGQAVLLYQQILGSGEGSGPLFYNLGNTYFKQGNLGRAILSYERALQYMPRDTDLEANYHYALSLVGKTDTQESSNIVMKIVRHHFQFYTINEISWILLMLVFIFAIAHLAGLYFSWRLGRKILSLSIILAFVVFYASGLVLKIEYLQSRGIIVKDTSARFEPREDATVYFSLFEGNGANVIKRENGWTKIKRFDGKTGWIKSAMIEKIQTSLTKGADNEKN